MSFTRFLWLAFVCCVLIPGSNGAEEKLDPAGVEFFENKIRPVLVETCYQCHSQETEKLKGGLYLDTRDGLLTGGDNGPAIVAGDPEKSLLIRAIRYTDENLQMPPKNKKLSNEQIADFEAWVKMGAPDPRTGENKALADRENQKKSHWAFQPVANPEPPSIKSDWIRNSIDAFVLAKLKENQFTPSKETDRRTFIRRASFDLLGIPPTHEEVEAFVNDKSELAYETLIDRLLASPLYGERWARHWLDVARYADTKGYVFEEERRYPYSYTYRDYVIRAFNEDLGFDRFIVEQIAADQLELGEDKRPLAAMGFLTLGRRFLNNQPDIIDDRIDVVTRGFMGLTVQCARCHDHKYDPIPTADYYSLYGVFASSSEPGDKPLLGTKSLPREYPQYMEERKKREDELESFRAEKEGEALAELRKKTAEYLLAAYDGEKLDDKSKTENLAKERKLSPSVVRRWMNYLEERQKKDTNDTIFGPWFAFASLSESNFASEASAIVERFSGEGKPSLNARVAKTLEGTAPASMKEVAERYSKIFEEIDTAWTAAKKENSSIEKLESEEQESLRQVLYAADAPANLPSGEIPRLFDVPTAQKSRALKRKLEELDATHPGAPPRGMVMVDNPTPTKPRIFVRGSRHNEGDEVPRQFLELIAGPDRKPFEKGSGRLELAQAIASDDNPLTARVIVNRVWLNHFGSGLVKTPSDFGLRSDPPTHPELLDYLSSYLIESNWSLKKLHRLILLSNTYRQRSEDRPDYLEKDPNNNLLWRMNRRRLEFEPFRDTLLAVSGKLELTQGGHPVEITTEPFTSRRSVYAFIERQNLPGLFRTFDFASPDTSSAQRFNTTVPQQALFMINSPFVVNQARSFAARPEIKNAEQSGQKIKAMYAAAFQRAPSERELKLAEKFVEAQKQIPPPEPPLEVWKYGYGHLDLEKHKLIAFTPLPHFTGKAWQGGNNLPHEKLGWLTLNNNGGHPGQGMDHVIIRRWTAPFDCTIDISGTLSHGVAKGDGVRGRIIHSRLGELGFWPVYNSKQEMNIGKVQARKGETIDFVVDMNTNLDSDSFNWAPTINAVAQSESSGSASKWSAQDDFGGPKELPIPLKPWEKLAQVLLMSNELAFVD